MKRYSQMTNEEFIIYLSKYMIDGCHPQICDEAAERLQKPINCNNCVLVQLKSKEVKQIKSEAIKEFAERLKGKAEPEAFHSHLKIIRIGEIDNIVKEMAASDND